MTADAAQGVQSIKGAGPDAGGRGHRGAGPCSRRRGGRGRGGRTPIVRCGGVHGGRHPRWRLHGLRTGNSVCGQARLRIGHTWLAPALHPLHGPASAPHLLDGRCTLRHLLGKQVCGLWCTWAALPVGLCLRHGGGRRCQAGQRPGLRRRRRRSGRRGVNGRLAAGGAGWGAGGGGLPYLGSMPFRIMGSAPSGIPGPVALNGLKSGAAQHGKQQCQEST